ncbi:MAG: hypothetical protein ACRD3T_00030 [Terriglobia bacterium]
MDRLEQVEKNLVEISGNLLVQAQLMDRLERRVDDFHRETRERFEKLEEQVDENQARAAQHEIELQEFRATVARVLDLLERFVAGRGQSGNGNEE